MAKIFETLKFDLSEEELEQGPVLFLIMEEPEVFAQLVLDRALKIQGVTMSSYRQKDFLKSFRDVEYEGLRKIVDNDGVNLELEFPDSTVNSITVSFKIRRSTLNISFGRSVLYSFDARNNSVHQFLDWFESKVVKYNERVREAKSEDDYRRIRKDLISGDSDYAYDYGIEKFSTKNIEVDVGEDSFSKKTDILYLSLGSEFLDLIQSAKLEGSYSTISTTSFVATIKDLEQVITNLQNYCDENNLVMGEPHPDGPWSIRIHRSKESKDVVIANNLNSCNKYRERYLSEKIFQRAIEQQRKFIAKVLENEAR